jgi:two-component system cell cycle sensor histidine kinase/response regulator CckA
MIDEDRTKQQLVKELEKLRRRNVELEQIEAECKRSGELLEKERETFFPVLHKAPYGVALIDKDEKFIYINPAFTNITGYTLKDIFAGRDWFHSASPFPEYREQIITSWRRDVIQKGVEKTFSVVCKEGEIKEIEFKPTLLDDGTIIVILFDITERRRAEVALRDSETKFRRLTETTTAAIFIYQGTKLRYANPITETLTGYTKEEFLAMDFWEVVHPDHRDLVKKRGLARQRGEQVPPNYEFKILTKKGEERWVDFTGVSIELEGKSAVLGTAYDITDRKRAEGALRHSEEQYRLITENTKDLICTLDLQGNFNYVSPSFKEVLGYSSEELIGLNAFSLIHPDDREAIIKIYQQALIKKESRTVQFRYQDRNSHWHIFESVGNWIFDGNGTPQKGVIVSRDITERKKAEQALRESEEKFRDLIENINDVIYTLNTDGIITYLSPVVEQVLGYKPAEVIGQPFNRFIHEEDLPRMRERFSELLEGKLGPNEYRIMMKNGGVRWVCISSRPLYREGSVIGIRGSLIDVTERKQAEEKMAILQEQFRQSQKLEAIGRLAGGIAHDFNNILAVIQGYSELCLFKIAKEDPMREDIETIINAGKRAVNLVGQLLTFSRRKAMEMKVIELNPLLQNLEKMLRRVIGEDVELITVLADNLGRVKVDSGQIEQILLNLAVNARDAMPSGGKLTIETADVTLDETFRENPIGLKPGHYVMISMTDTGLGMTQEVKEQIFEPFFTTKEIGKGTGLGLSMVYGIVKQSGGHIWVESGLGKGTTFRIYLPRVDEVVVEVEEKEVSGLPRGNETILVVEDEEEVRKLTARILRKQGYNVLEASQGKEAFSLCEEQEGPIHLMVTDVVMPEMPGAELAKRFTQFYPEIKVLYMSGYTLDRVAIGHGNLEKGIEFIQKPFTIDRLAKKIREVLDKQFSIV